MSHKDVLGKKRNKKKVPLRSANYVKLDILNKQVFITATITHTLFNDTEEAQGYGLCLSLTQAILTQACTKTC